MAIDGPLDGETPEVDDGVDTTCEIDLASLTGEQMTELLTRIPGAIEGIKQGWQDFLDGNFFPISEL